jgi:hypothetical protein
MKKFNAIYIIKVNHRTDPELLTFWSDDEIKDYAICNVADWDIETIEDAFEALTTDCYRGFMIRSEQELKDAFERATGHAAQARELFIEIANNEGVEL